MQACILLTISLCLAVGSLAQRPEPCRSPPFMEGSVTAVFPKMGYSVVEKFAYDGFGEKEYFQALVTHNNHTVFRENLFLFKEGVYYEIYRHNKTCTTAPIKATWFPLGIPNDAQFQSQVIIGTSAAPGEGLLVNNWIGKLPEYKAKYFMTFTEFGCLPVTAMYDIENEGYIFSSFYNIVLGIENPEVFIPPIYCGKA